MTEEYLQRPNTTMHAARSREELASRAEKARILKQGQKQLNREKNITDYEKRFSDWAKDDKNNKLMVDELVKMKNEKRHQYYDNAK